MLLSRCRAKLKHRRSAQRKGVHLRWHLKDSGEVYTKTFARVVKASGVDGLVPDDQTPPTPHEVRALAGIVNLVHGKSEQEVQRLMAHKDAKMTQHYLSDHQGIKYLGATLSISLSQNCL